MNRTRDQILIALAVIALLYVGKALFIPLAYSLLLALVLYPMVEWEHTQTTMRRLNRFVAKNVEFVRRFMNGATPIELDASDRLLLPKHLLAHAGIGKGLRMVGMMDRVEIWSTDTHVKMLREKVDLTALAEDVMGSLGNADEE